MKHGQDRGVSVNLNVAMWACYLPVILTLFSAIDSILGKNEAIRETELDDLTRNDTHTSHNTIRPRILVGFNKTGALVSGRYTDPYRDNVPLPVSIEVIEGSNLVAEPGRQWKIIFQVTSNLPYTRTYSFTAEDQSQSPIYIMPSKAEISSGNTVQCQVTIPSISRTVGSSSSIATFYVTWFDNYRPTEERKKVYLYSGTQDSDSYSPDISYDYDGDCSGTSPRNCEVKNWKAKISVQDGSGLLSIKSFPIGLILQNEFIVGTKDTVKGYYSATCCLTKVDIVAVDLLGNSRVTHLDVERRWLSAGDIAAIVLACILLIIIIAFIIWLIVYCCRRRKSNILKVYSSHTRRGED